MTRAGFLSLIAGSAFAQKPRLNVEQRIRQLLATAPGTLYLFGKNLDNNKIYAIRPDEKVRTASTIKVPMMVAAFGEVDAGRAKWDEPIQLREEDKIGGAGVLREFSNGLRVPLRDLLHLMIVISDNTATNLVLDRIPADVVNQYMDRYGLTQTRALRKIMGASGAGGISKAGEDPANSRYGLGVSTAREMVTLLEKIENGEVINPAACKEMLAILKRQQLLDGMGRRLSGTVLAAKSGALDALRSDIGIIYSKRGRIAIAATVDGMKKPDWSPDNPGLLFLARLTPLIIEAIGK